MTRNVFGLLLISLHVLQLSRTTLQVIFLLVMAGQANTALAQAAGADDPAWTVTRSITQTINQTWRALAIQPDGKIVAASQPSGAFAVSRFNHSGELDLSFGNGGTASAQVGINSIAEHVVVDAAGRIYVAGSYYEILFNDFGTIVTGFAVARFLPNGTRDLTYGNSGIAKIPLDVERRGASTHPDGAEQLFDLIPTTIAGIALQPNGKLVLLTHAREYPPVTGTSLVLVRFNTDGKLDRTFANNGLALIRISGSGEAKALAVMKDGSIIAVGRGYVSATFRTGFVIKLTPRGVIDTAFGMNGKVTVEPQDVFTGFAADAVAIQDDRIIIGGTRALSGSVEETMVFELNANGVLNPDFGENGFSFNDLAPNQERLAGLELEPNGRIIVAGTANAVNVETEPYLARLTRNGQVDASFVPMNVRIPRHRAVDLLVWDAAYMLTHGWATSDPNVTVVRKFITETASAQPNVSISGGNRTLDDTDSVAGEIMNFTGVASDTDGTIQRTIWTLNGVEAGTGASVRLTLQDGPNIVSFTAIDDDGAKATASVAINIKVPAQPLPRISGVSNQQAATDSQFSVAIRNANGVLGNTASTTQTLHINGYIFPGEADRNFRADVFVVVATSSGWLMRNPEGVFVPWNARDADLVPAYRNLPLAIQTPVNMYSGTIKVPGSYRLFLGYRRTDGNELVYSSSTPLQISTP